MKQLTFAFILLASILIIQGCTGKAAGSDSAYLNQNRGAAGAQISRQEAAQYSRQQRLSADEVRLENMKRRQATDAIEEGASAANSTAGALNSGVGAVNRLKGLIGW
jgi:hypothetical protein